MDAVTAAKEFGVGKSTIHNYIRAEKAKRRLAARVGSFSDIPRSMQLALADIQADKVFEEAFNAYKTLKIPSVELAKLIREIVKNDTEQMQTSALKTGLDLLTKEFSTPVRSTKRTSFLRILTSVENQLKGVSSIRSLDITEQELKGVKERCKLIANILSSL
jgi:hypothetical protein